jgi:hypothetical protein
MDECNFLNSLLVSTGWHIKLEWIQAFLEHLHNVQQFNRSSLVEAAIPQLLLVDFMIVGNGGLPKNFGEITRGLLEEPVVVQVETVEDVSQSQRARTFSQKDSIIHKNEG